MVDITARTHLGRRLKPSDTQNGDSILLRLVFKQGVETGYGNVFESLRKVMVFHHIACGERFETDSVVFIHQVMGNLVEKIIPLIGNSFMRPCEFEPCTLPVLGTFCFLGEGALQTLNLLDRAFQIFVILYFRTVRQHGKRLDAKVNSNRFAFADWLCLRIILVYLNENGNIIFVCRCPCDNGCLDKTLKLSMEASLNPFPEFGNVNPTFIEFHSRVLRYGKALPIVFLGLELWEALLLTEEFHVSGVEIGKCSLQGKGVYLGDPAVFLGLLHLWQLCLNVVSGNVGLVLLVGFHFLVKCVVVQETATAEMLCDEHLLWLCRVNPVFVRLVFHATKIQNNLEIPKRISKKRRNSSTQAEDLWDFLRNLFKFMSC